MYVCVFVSICGGVLCSSWSGITSPCLSSPLLSSQVIEKYTLETGSSGQGEGMQLCVRYFISSIEVIQ